MGKFVGIDLGTTHSVVAIPGARTGEGFALVEGHSASTVITDTYGRAFMPSVVAEDAAGQLLVGRQAKNRAGMNPGPIMFAKRRMGTDEVYVLPKRGQLTPEQISAEVLRELKRLVELRLGETVDQVTLTHPAWFLKQARDKTIEAAKLAGFTEVRLVPEPVAAAVMYCGNDPRPDLTVLTYDLGGGTFDVAVVEKKDGVISKDSIKAFGGHRFLGGYNFDKALMRVILGKLVGPPSGYDLSVAELSEAPTPIAPQTDAATGPDELFAKLMVFAEEAKHGLSRADHYNLVHLTSGLVDAQGEPVEIDIQITREEFDRAIDGIVTETIEISLETLQKAFGEDSGPEGGRPDAAALFARIDEVVMVGGSSRVPLVQEKVKAVSGRAPKLVEPDLCVGLGAAMLAGTQATEALGALTLDPVPTETDDQTVVVSGRVHADRPETCRLRVTSTDGAFVQQRSPEANGRFTFPMVEVAEGEVTDFVLTLSDSEGANLLEHHFSVRQTESPVTGGLSPIQNLLAKDLAIKAAGGITIFAEATTALPYQTEIKALTTDTSGEVRIPILEDQQELGILVVRDVPPSVPVGSAVDITIDIDANYQIEAKANLPSVALDGKVSLQIPVERTPGKAELQERHAALTRKWSETKTAARANRVFEYGAECQQQLDKAKQLLDDPRLDAGEVQECLRRVSLLIDRMNAGWQPEPSKWHVDALLRQIDELLGNLPNQREYEPTVAAARRDVVSAFQQEDLLAWQKAFSVASRLKTTLEGIQPPPAAGAAGPGAETTGPDPQRYRESVLEQLDGLERRVAATLQSSNPRVRDSHRELDARCRAARVALEALDPQASDYWPRIHDVTDTRIVPLRNALDALERGKGEVEVVGA